MGARGHLVACQHPVGPLADIGPGANRRDAALQRIDIACHVVEFGYPRRGIIRAEIPFLQVLPQPRDETGMDVRPPRAEIGQRTRFPEAPYLACAPNRCGEGFFRQPLQRRKVDRFGRGAQHGMLWRAFEIADQRGDTVKPRLRLAPVEMRQRREAMVLDRVDFILGEFGRGRVPAALSGESAERSVALVAPGTPGDLGHFRRKQPPHPYSVEFGEPCKGDVVDVEIEAHADRVGGDDVIDLAILEQFDLTVAGFRAQRAHHHRRAAAKPPQHFGHGIDLLGTEGDDRASGRKAREFARADMRQRRKPWPLADLDLRDQRLHHRFQRGRAQQHRLLPTAQIEQAIGKDMATLAIGAQLRLVQPNETDVETARHGFDRAAQIARVLRLDPLFAGNQRHLIVTLDGAHAVIDLARQQPQRKADRSARMAAHPLDGEMGLAGIGRPQDRLDRLIAHAGVDGRRAGRAQPSAA